MDRKTAMLKAHELVAKMTVAEAASQLIFNSPAIERLGIPSYNWWNETLHGIARGGTATVFPQAIGMAATFDKDLIRKEAEVCAAEGRAKYNAAVASDDRDMYKGVNFWTPNINIFRDPRWGRGQETYGEDPVLTAELGAAFVKGLQGDGEVMTAAACAKHFAVHSGPEELRHSFDAKCSEKDLFETYLPAFKELVDCGVESVMGAYNRFEGEPCCGHSRLIGNILRDKWNFKGHFVSDCWAVRDFHQSHKVTSCPEESVSMALKNGCDLNCGCTYQYVMSAYEKGLVSESDIRTCAERLYTTRYLLGIMEGSEYDSIPITEVCSAEHLALSKKAAQEACVLLKNNGILPLNPAKLKTVAVIGPNADSVSALKGNYHGTTIMDRTILRGIQSALPEARVLFSEGCHLFRDRVEPLALPDDRISEAVAMAKVSDAVLLVVGLDETLEGEEGDTGNSYKSGDKGDLLLPEGQRNLMKAVLSAGKPTVIILMAGSSIDLQDAGEKADAVLLSWYPGDMGGDAVADILFGKVSPSGKLPVTFYHNSDLKKMPDFTDYRMEGRTYRYFRDEPLYPFGFGLTYGNVKVLSASQSVTGGKIRVDVELENSGKTDTDEVVQIYARNEGSVHAPLNPRLVAFSRVSCPVGKTIRVSIDVRPDRLLVIDDSGALVSEGKCILAVSLNGCRSADFELSV